MHNGQLTVDSFNNKIFYKMESIVAAKSYAFAIRIINLYKFLTMK
jgi:hypothetical protein